MQTSDQESLEQDILGQAQEMYDRRVSAVDFSNRLFGPNGLVRRLWTTRADRTALVNSELFRTLKKQLRALEKIEVSHFERDIADYAELRRAHEVNAVRKKPEAA